MSRRDRTIGHQLLKYWTWIADIDSEHAFRVVKQLWGFTKVRFRGLAKNTARLFTMFALANLYMVRRRLLPA
jgi:IS5 family transposase